MYVILLLTLEKGVSGIYFQRQSHSQFNHGVLFRIMFLFCVPLFISPALSIPIPFDLLKRLKSAACLWLEPAKQMTLTPVNRMPTLKVTIKRHRHQERR